ncbi:sulfurtransferase [Flexistipes sp.]|uniref:sulfurtransferase n=1 Tax=Flexistipes sp. TaxID=3088135 RepID=UPI002E21DD20|nr:rhodanese-like domain-containing protein [Flexistipes sp.]
MFKIWSKKHLLSLVTVLFFAMASLVIVSCGSGGGSDYEAPEAGADKPAWWSGYYPEGDFNSLVEPAKLAEWINNGFQTENGNPVVVLDLNTDFDNASQNRIKRSVAVSDIESWTIQVPRDEGPISAANDADFNSGLSKMIPNGATIDSIIQDLGLQHDTVLVLAGQTPYRSWDMTRGWWMLYYWGFSQKNIRILNGGIDDVAAVDSSIVDTTSESVDPADSTFCVQDLPKMHQDARASTFDVLEGVKSGTVNIIDARGFTGPVPPFYQIGFNGRIKGASVIPFPAVHENSHAFKTTEVSDIADVVAEGKRIIVHCFSAYSASPVYFYIKNVLGYDNVALYDGSISAWVAHTGYQLANGSTVQLNDNASNVSDTTRYLWNGQQFVEFDDNNTNYELDSDEFIRNIPTDEIELGGVLQADGQSGMLQYDTMRYSVIDAFSPNSVWMDAYGNVKLDVNLDYTGNGNEIEKADLDYVTPDVTENTDSSQDTTSDEAYVPSDSGFGC